MDRLNDPLLSPTVTDGETMLKSAPKLAKVKTTESSDLNPYALMNCECLVLTEGGLKSLTERLDAGRVA